MSLGHQSSEDVAGMNKPVNGELIENLSDQLREFVSKEAASARLPVTLPETDSLVLALKSLIDVSVDLLVETHQVHYVETVIAVTDVLEPPTDSAKTNSKTTAICQPNFSDGRRYRSSLRSKSLAYIASTAKCHIDDAAFVLAFLRAGVQGLMCFYHPTSVRQYAIKRLQRLAFDVVEPSISSGDEQMKNSVD